MIAYKGLSRYVIWIHLPILLSLRLKKNVEISAEEEMLHLQYTSTWDTDMAYTSLLNHLGSLITICKHSISSKLSGWIILIFERLCTQTVLEQQINQLFYFSEVHRSYLF